MIPRPSASTQNYILEPRGIAKFDNQFFWTERQSIWQALQTGPKNFLVRKVSAFEANPSMIVVVNPLRPGGKELWVERWEWGSFDSCHITLLIIPNRAHRTPIFSALLCEQRRLIAAVLVVQLYSPSVWVFPKHHLQRDMCNLYVMSEIRLVVSLLLVPLQLVSHCTSSCPLQLQP